MAPALVHFTVGFVLVLGVLWLIPITRYRLTGAFGGGIWGIVPDARFLLDGGRRARLEEIHDTQLADLFFFHHTLDQPVFRDSEIELTFLALAALGTALLLYDWRFGRRAPRIRRRTTTDPTTTESD